MMNRRLRCSARTVPIIAGRALKRQEKNKNVRKKSELPARAKLRLMLHRAGDGACGVLESRFNVWEAGGGTAALQWPGLFTYPYRTRPPCALTCFGPTSYARQGGRVCFRGVPISFRLGFSHIARWLSSGIRDN